MKTLAQVTQEAERGYLTDALAKLDGDMMAVARIADIALMTAYRRLHALSIPLPKRPYRKRTEADSLPKRPRRRRVSQVLPKAKLRIESLLPFFGVPCDSRRSGGDFWSRHSGQIDAMMFDARKNYMAMVRKHHEAGESPDAERLSRINALWQQLVATARRHGVEC